MQLNNFVRSSITALPLGVELGALVKFVWLQKETQDDCAVNASSFMAVSRGPPYVVTGESFSFVVFKGPGNHPGLFDVHVLMSGDNGSRFKFKKNC